MQQIDPVQPTVYEIPFKPHVSQKRFLDELMFCDWRAAIGGTSSGKTYLGGFELIRLCSNFLGIESVAFSPTFGMIKRNVIPVLKELLGGNLNKHPLVHKFNKSDMVLDWESGSTTWFNSLEYPERSEGQSLDLVWVDEPRLVRHLELALMVIQRRLRGSPTGRAMGFSPKGYLTTTPDYPGSELHDFCENPEKRHPHLKLFRMPLQDNAENLPENFIENIIRTHQGGLADRFIEGFFANVEAGSFQYDYAIHTQGFKEPDRRTTSVRYGMDFGWTNPSAILVIKIDGDGRAYVVEEVYGRRLSMDQLSAYLHRLYEAHGEGPVICDRSRPDSIQSLVDQGIDAVPDKSKRDDGIADLGGRFKDAGDGRPRIYISPECVNLIDELQTYDEDLKVRDHACFVEGTKIKTKDGYKLIEEITRSDYALTRLDYNHITDQGITDKQANIYRLTTSNGDILHGTANHPIWVEGLGFQRMDSLRYPFILDSLRYSDRKWLKKSFTKGNHIADTLIPLIEQTEFITDQQAGRETPSTFIEKYTKIIMEKYPRNITYTTSMITLLIMIQKTLNAYQKNLTYHTTLKNYLKTKNTKKNNSNTSTALDISLNRGTHLKKAINGIASTGSTHLRKQSKRSKKRVTNAELSTPTGQLIKMDDSAQTTVNQRGDENLVLMTKNAYVVYAELYSRLINTVKPVPVHVVAVVNLGIKESVYNLTVNKTHEYYANDLLVSNCDALRYGLAGLIISDEWDPSKLALSLGPRVGSRRRRIR